MKTSLIIYGTLSLYLGCVLIGSFTHLYSPPKHSPAEFLAANDRNEGEVLVCVGDSITHGHVSEDYVFSLRNEFGESIEVVNAGINSELAFNVLSRIDTVISCEPDYVTLLIGTNDANKSFDRESAIGAVEKQGLPDLPSSLEYEKHLRLIVTRLLDETDAKIALLSPPPIGENRQSEIYVHSKKFAGIAKKIASEYQLTYLPLFEAIDSKITVDTDALSIKQSMRRMYGSIISHYMLGYTFDKISRIYGYSYHADELHLNSAGAGIISSLISDFIVEVR